MINCDDFTNRDAINCYGFLDHSSIEKVSFEGGLLNEKIIFDEVFQRFYPEGILSVNGLEFCTNLRKGKR